MTTDLAKEDGPKLVNAAPSTRKHELTPSQAQLFMEVEQRRRNAEKEWAMAITLAGLDPKQIVSGDLGPDDPHFIVKVDAPTA